MTMKRILALATILALLIQTSAAVSAELVTTDPVVVSSGDTFTAYVQLTNTGRDDVDNVTAVVKDRYPFSVVPGRDRRFSFSSLEAGEVYTFSTELRVAENASEEPHPIALDVSSGSFTTTHHLDLQVQDRAVQLDVANMQTAPDTLRPDTEGNRLTVEVVNTGDGTAENVVLDLDLPAGFERSGAVSDRHAFGSLQPGAAKPATFTVDLAETVGNGTHVVEGTLTYRPDDGAETTDHVAIPLHVAGTPQFAVRNVTADLATGTTGRVTAVVENVGSATSTATRLRVLDSADMPFDYESASAYVGTLDPGETGTAAFTVTVDSGAVAKDYLVDLEARGVKDTSVFVEPSTVRLPVAGGDGGDLPLLPLAAAVIAGAGLFGFGYAVRRRMDAHGED